MWVAFHENDGTHGKDENDKDNSDSYKQEVECWITENHENPGCKPRVPQTTGLDHLEIPFIIGNEFLPNRFTKCPIL